MRLLPILVLFLAAGCAGFRPVAPDPVQVYAGETTRIDLPVPPPAGERVRWHPGEGSAPVEGPSLVHAWQRPGLHTVVVEGGGGSAAFEVEVLPRPVLRIIPDGVRFAVALPGVWSSWPRLAAFAKRFSPDGAVGSFVDRLRERLGADPGDPTQLAARGIDPAEDLAFVVFDFDPSSAWVLLGVLDDEKAEALGRRILEIEAAEPVEVEGGRLWVGLLPTGEMRVFAVVGGYLAMRASDEAGAIEEAVRVLAATRGGLAAFEPFQQARALAPGEDAIFFTQLPEEGGGWMRLVVGLELAESAAVARFGMPLDPRAAAEAAVAIGRSPGRSEALDRFPAGAVGHLSLSLEPQALFELAFPEPMRRAFFEAMVRERTGVPLTRLLRDLTGKASAAIYFDAQAFTELVAALVAGADDGRLDTWPPLLARVELRGEGAGEDLLAVLRKTALFAGDGWWQRGPLFFRVEEGVLQVATMRARHMRRAEGTADLREVFPPGVLDRQGVQALHLDVGAIFGALRSLEARSAEAAVVRTLLLEEAAFLAPVQRALLFGTVVPEGVQGELRLELAPVAE